MDVHGPAAHEARQHDGEDGEQDEGDDRRHLLALHVLPELVIDGEADHDQHQAQPSRGVGLHRGVHRAALPVDDEEQQQTADPGVGGTPAEPVERPRHELGQDLLLALRGVGLGELRVDEVEEPQVTDPHDPGQDVDPTEDEVEELAHGLLSFR